MQPTLVDTDILSFFLRGDQNVAKCFERYLSQYNKLNLSIITYYEIISGLKYKDAKKQLDVFRELVKCNQVLPLTSEACERAADIYALCRQQGNPIDDIDLLIAGIALENNLALATHNVSHFSRINGLSVIDWTLEAAP